MGGLVDGYTMDTEDEPREILNDNARTSIYMTSLMFMAIAMNWATLKYLQI